MTDTKFSFWDLGGTHSRSGKTTEATLSTLSWQTNNTTLSSDTAGSRDTSWTLREDTQAEVSHCSGTPQTKNKIQIHGLHSA